MADLENDIGKRGGKYHMDETVDNETALRNIRTAGSLSISPELFEKLYLSPKNQVSNNLRTTFGNPTPLQELPATIPTAIAGLVLALTPLSNALLGWRGAGGLGAAQIGAFFYFGGLLMVLAAVLEFFLANTFPFVVFGTIGAFFFTYGTTLTPFYNAAGAYSPDNPAAGAAEPGFLATLAFFFLWMGVMCFVYLICSLRTNIIFFMIFLLLVPTFCCLAGSFWQAAQGNSALAVTLQHAGGGLAFAACLFGWYLFLVLCLASVDFPLALPVGDLSRFIKGASEKQKAA